MPGCLQSSRSSAHPCRVTPTGKADGVFLSTLLSAFYHTRPDVSFAPTEKTRAKQQSQCKSKKRSNIPIASTSRFARFQWHSVQGILRPWMYSVFVLVALARIPPYTLHNSATVSFFSTGMAEFGGIMAEFGGIILPEIELVAIL